MTLEQFLNSGNNNKIKANSSMSTSVKFIYI